MNSLIYSYLKYIKCERKYSDYTIKSYEEDLSLYEKFVRTLVGEFNPIILDKDMARMWMSEMSQQKIKVSTIKRRLCSLRSFYKYLRRENLIKENPLSLIPSPRIPKPLPAWVTEAQMDALLDDIDFGHDFIGKRDRLLIDLIYSTGMRRSEAAGLRMADVDLENKTIKIWGKGGKVRLVPFGEELFVLLKDFIKEKYCLLGEKTDFVLVNENGEQLSPQKVASIVKKYLSQIPTLARPTTHILRHSFATNMLVNGAALMSVKELLGHASLQSTEIYTHLSPQEILSNYKQAHPRSKK